VDWGVVGKNQWGRDPRVKSSRAVAVHGVLRDVEAGVDYQSPSAEAIGMSVWQRLGDELDDQHRWFMPLGQSEPPTQTITLYGLAVELHKRRDKLTEPEAAPLLALIDTAVGRLCEVAAALHEQGRSLGILHPNNILLYLPAPGAEWQLVLPDVGFGWRWQGVGNVPAWLKPTDPHVKPFLGLWDVDLQEWNKRICKQQWADAPRPTEPWEAADDVRVLARIVYWVLTGRVSKNVALPNDAEPWSKSPALTGLAAALAEGNTDFGALQLREAMTSKGKRPSDFFTASHLPVEAAGPSFLARAGRVVLWGLLLVAVLGGVASLAYVVPHLVPEAKVDPQTGLAESSKLFPMLPEFRAAQGDRVKMFGVLCRMHQVELSSAAPIKKKEIEVLGQSRREYCELWLRDAKELTTDTRPPGDAEAIKKRLERYEQLEKEQQTFLELPTHQSEEDPACRNEMLSYAEVFAYDKGVLQRMLR
jgi:hypothetical protein